MSIVWSRFGALTLGALSMALSFCHLMELLPRLRWEPSLWMAATVFGGLYALFGSVGALIDIGALIAVAVLTLAVRRRPGFRAAAAGAALFFGAHALWWAFVFPMNGVLATWRPGVVPADFVSVRNQWEYAHAVIAVVKLAGFMALVLSVLDETRPRPGR